MFDPVTLVELTVSRARTQPSALAYRFLVSGEVDGEIREWTFADLDRRARAIGAWLQDAGYAGERAVLLFPPGVEFMESFLGCLYAGVIAVPAFPPRSERTLPRLQAIIANARPRLVLATASIANSARAMSERAADLRALRWQVCSEIPDGIESAWRAPTIDPSTIAFLQYTSGSTGTPKGVMVSHGNLLSNQRVMCRASRTSEQDLEGWQGDVYASWLPLQHDMGLIGPALQTLYTGRSTTLMSPLHFLQKPFRWLHAISHFGAHSVGAPNFAYELCVSKVGGHPELLAKLDLSRLDAASNGAEPVRWETLKRFSETFAPCGFRPEAFVPCYGMAEATLMVSGWRPRREPTVLHLDPEAMLEGRTEPNPNGRPAVSCGHWYEDLKIVDPATCVECPEGVVGEVWLHGPSVAHGYWQDERATAETFHARVRDAAGSDRKYLRTGDLGFVRERELFITGRLKDLMIIDGANHYPHDVELTVERAHKSIYASGAAAFTVDTPEGERVVVIAEAKPTIAADPEPVFDAIRAAVSDVHGLAPRAIVLVRPQSLLKTSSGKVRRRACKAAFLAGDLSQIARKDYAPEPESTFTPQPTAAVSIQMLTAAERTRAEALLVELVARRASLAPAAVDRQRALTELGLGSRALVELSAELGAALGRELPATLFFDSPSIASALDALAGSADPQPRTPLAARRDEPIAIVSMACRLPAGIDSPDAYWDLLARGAEALEPFPERWAHLDLYDPTAGTPGKSCVREGGFIHDSDAFDAAFFGIAPREALSMDPQQRLVLETAWEALERAGITLAEGNATGVYLGACGSDYARLTVQSDEDLDGHQATSTAASAISGRLSYVLGLQGPALTIDTACSSSLVAVHVACQALRQGECDIALAGGVTVMATPSLFIEFTQLGGLAPDGRCKSFGASADGTAWGEGCGIVVLEPLSAAAERGHHVLAVIRGSAVNQDGHSQGFSAPSGPSQQRVIRDALALSGLAPADLDAVEAHGTGTALGDPIEAGALAAVFGPGRPSERPLQLGSAKSNLGHTVAAAGVAGLMKMVLALQHERLPKTLNAEQPSPHIAWQGSGLQLLQESRAWPRGERVRRAGVSSFGVSGTNAHLIVEEAPLRAAEPSALAPVPAGLPLVVSGKDEPALRAQAGRLAAWLRERGEAVLPAAVRSAALHRTHFAQRAAVLSSSTSEALSALDALSAGQRHAALVQGQVQRGGKVVFVYPGQGSQWPGMGRALLEQSAVFAETVRACDAALKPWTGWSVLALLRGDEDASLPPLTRVDAVQPALFAMSLGLSALWRELGVTPAAVVGHSQGEVSAAVVSGALSLQDGAKVVALRSQAVRERSGQGGMLLIERPVAEVEGWLAAYGGALSVAAVNTASSTVVSGESEALTHLLSELEKKALFARRVNVDYASHSAQMDGLLPQLRAALGDLSPRAGAIPLYSTVTSERLQGGELDAEYWCRNLRQTVRFDASLSQLMADGHGVFVEVSAHPVLALTLSALGEGTVVVGSVQRERGELTQLYRSLAELHVHGHELDWAKLLGSERAPVLALPTYAFQRQRYWVDRQQQPAAAGLEVSDHPLLGTWLESPRDGHGVFVSTWSRRSARWLADHTVFGEVVVSGTTTLELCRAALQRARPDAELQVAQLELLAPLVLPEHGRLQLQVEVSESTAGELEVAVHSRALGADAAGWTLHATANAAPAAPATGPSAPSWPVADSDDWGPDAYAALERLGLGYRGSFRGVRTAVRLNEDVALARLALPDTADAGACYGVHPALLDAALQVCTLLCAGDEVMLPASIASFSLARSGLTELTARVERKERSAAAASFDIGLWDSHGAWVGQLAGLQVRRATRASLAQKVNSARDLYEVAWQPLAYGASAVVSGNWLLVADASDEADTLAAQLTAAGVQLSRALPDAVHPSGLAGVLRLWPSAEPGEVAAHTQALTVQGLSELQAALAAEHAPQQLVWITRGAVASAPEEGVACLWQAGLWGLARSARAEHPELGLRLVDLDSLRRDAAPLMAALAQPGEPELAIRATQLRVPRLLRAETRARLELPEAPYYQLQSAELGRLDRLELVAAERPALEAHQVRISVHSAGMNFRDVVRALDVQASELASRASLDTPLGSECAGVVLEVGADVREFQPGQRVVAIAAGAFANEAIAEAQLTAAIPDALSFADAATLPIAFGTAYYGLRDLAAVQPGERILVHAAAGGVGMAALQLARLWQLDVFATASEPKWRVLRELGVAPERIASSRDLTFARQFEHRFDVVLNSLAREYVDASLDLLAEQGRFLEMGKTDVRSEASIAVSHPGVRYRAYDFMLAGTERVGEILRAIVAHVARGELTPLRKQRFALEDARAAFRWMAQGGHVGKLVLDVAPAPLVPQTGTVLITGGLGGVGFVTARWLVEQGAKRLLLTSRQGSSDPRAAEVRQTLSALGAEVDVAACDVADRAALAALLAAIPESAPLRGVVHSAAVLDDALLVDQSEARVARVMASKVWGAWNLHELTAQLPLELFVVYSSAAGVAGNRGQSNYAAANVFLDQLCCERKSRGLPGTSLSWGAWSEVGLATTHLDLARAARSGMAALTPSQGIALLELALRRRAPHLVPWALRPAQLQKTFAAGVPPLFQALVQPPRANREARLGLSDSLSRLPAEARAERVVALLCEDAAQVLGLRSASDISPSQPLRQLGLDSLMAVELRNRISARFDFKPPATLLFDYPTLEGLARHLLEHVIELDVEPASSVAVLQPLAADEPIAILSMACRFPGGLNTPEALWEALAEGRDLVEDFPAERWDVGALYDPDPDAVGKSYARQGGFVRDIDQFDAAFFEITPLEAQSMDPQQRLLLETSWEALERAGIVPGSLHESSTGVYVGLYDSGYLEGSSLEQMDGYSATGSFTSVAAGRLAYTLGTQGPALSVDTACSSSLVAIHLAAGGLRSGECDLALAGGVSLMITPRGFVEFSRLRGLSPTGRCKSFSDDADGASWADGCGIVVLERLSQAQARGHQVLALVRSSAVNQDGKSQGLTAPNGPAQERVIRRALSLASLAPADIDYVEAHGTGTTLGDPIEANALANVFGSERRGGAAQPLWLGSLKSNLAHAQAAAGIGGLMKVVLSLLREQLPRTLHAERPTRHVDWQDSGLALVQQAQPWARASRVRRAGVSAFGISGTNAHVIVEEAPLTAAANATPAAAFADADWLFPVSARSEAALRKQAAQLLEHVEQNPALPLADAAATLMFGRTHFEWRSVVRARSRQDLEVRLAALARGGELPGLVQSPARAGTSGKLVFVFPGHGPQWLGMGKQLSQQSPVFARSLAECDAALLPHTGWSVRDVLNAEPGAPELERIDVVQPALFAMTVALSALWRSLGVEPDAVVGHSLGEIAAACVAGALPLTAAAKLVALRARSLLNLAGRGAMAAVELPAAELELRLRERYAGRLEVGGINSATSTSVSGDARAIDELLAELTREQVFARKIRIGFASHSSQMDEVQGELRALLSDVTGREGELPMYSSVLCEPVAGERLDVGYWSRNLREPVRFAATLDRLLADGYRTFLEVSPHPMLRLPIEAQAEAAGHTAVVCGSLRREEDAISCMLDAFAGLHVAGRKLDWSRLYGAHAGRAPLPTYAFDRQRHWLPAAPASHGHTAVSPLLQVHVESSDQPGRHVFESDIDLKDTTYSYLKDHRVLGAVWLPGAALLEMALEAMTQLDPEHAVALEDVTFAQAVELSEDGATRLQLVVQAEQGGRRTFSIASRPVRGSNGWAHHASGSMRVAEPLSTEVVPVSALRARCGRELAPQTLYARFAASGLEYGDAFRGIEAGWGSAREALARLAPRSQSKYVVHPALLDAALQSLGLLGEGPSGRTYVPTGVESLRIARVSAKPAWVVCSLRESARDASVLDYTLLDAEERPLVEVRGFRIVAAARLNSLLHSVRWKTLPPTASGSNGRRREPQGRWLILADASGVAARLTERLTATEHVVVHAARELAVDGAGHYHLDPSDRAHWQELFARAFAGGAPSAIVHLWSLDARPIDSASALADAQRLICTSTLHLTRAVAEHAGKRAPRLFFVTRGAQPARGSEDVRHPEQALGWGFVATVAQEHPELEPTLIDLDAEVSDVAPLWAALTKPDAEARMALRGSERWVPRIAKLSLPSSQPAAAKVTADKTYLVSGGLGDLGLVVAERLVALGARHIALLGRSAPSARREAQLGRLRGEGCEIYVVSADVTDHDSVLRALTGLRRGAPAIGGVVHAAGVLDDATLANLTPAQLSRVLGPKVLGAAFLAEQLPQLDFFVLFSSVTGVLGSAGQAAYAAANAYLDAWAHSRAERALPALSLDWGAWSDIGMASSASARANVKHSVVSPLTPEEGADLFELLLSTTLRQVAPVAFAPEAVAAVAEQLPLLADLAGVRASTGASGRVLAQLQAATQPQAQRAILETYLQSAVSRIAGGSLEAGVHTPLKELGLDSLMLLNLKNAVSRELSVPLATSKLLSLPTIALLAEHLRESLANGAGVDAQALESAPAERVDPHEPARRPATRDVMRLLRTEQQGTPSAAHNIGTAAQLHVGVRAEQLETILTNLALRHSALRTAIVSDAEHGHVQLVVPSLTAPLLRRSRLQGPGIRLAEINERLSALLEAPFDLASAPLWRFELLEGAAGEQVLLFGAHHAVCDARSLLIVLAEVDAELNGAELDRTPSNRDLDRLLVAQPFDSGAEADPAPIHWRKEFAGSKRLELTLASPRPPQPSYRMQSLCLSAPASLFERVAQQSSRLAVTPAAFYLGMLQALLARVSGQQRFAVAVPVDTRPHADAGDSLGFFGVPVPLPASAHLDEALSEIIRRTDGLFERVLRKGAAFSESLAALVAEGLYSEGAPLVEVFFNYINPQIYSFKTLSLIDAAAGYGDVDLMVIVVPELGHVRFDFHTDILDEASITLLGEAYLSLLSEVSERLAQRGEAGTLASWQLPAALAQAARASKPKRLALAATFAIGALSEFLDATFRDAGLPVVVEEAPYHQVLASLLDPGGVFAQPDAAAHVCLLRAVDLVRYSDSWSKAQLAALSDEYFAAFSRMADRAGGLVPIVVGFLPDASGDARFAAWDEKLAARLAKLPGVSVLRGDDWNRFYPVEERFDAATDAMGHLPFAPAFVASIALTLTRVVWGLKQRPLKVVAIDGDNTLWGGVAGEIGPEAVELGGARAQLAHKLLELRAAGVLLVLVSNNDEDTVLSVLKRPDSVLRPEHFSVISAAWDAKHRRLSQCARSLSLGLDSFLFLDDNPVEIAAVRAHLPEVMAVTVPEPEALESFIANLWALDVRAATQEDRRRADLYREEESRKILLRQVDDFASFVDSLRLELDIRLLDDDSLERSVQLSRRTNQFNLRPGAFAGASLGKLAKQPRTEVWTITVRDRFGDYGQVGVIVLSYDAHTVEVVQWMLSCRVLGRGVEERILHWLADRAVSLERVQVALIAEHTPRNIPARRMLAALGGGHVDNQVLSVTLEPERLKAMRLLERGDDTERTERIGEQDAQGL